MTVENSNNNVPLRMWLVEPLSTPVARTIERLQRLEDVAAIAIMPDVHLCHNVSVGTVVATRGTISPVAVGGDIGCGMLAMAFDIDAQSLQNARIAQKVLDDLSEYVPQDRHSRETAHQLPSELLASPLSDPSLQRQAEREGRLQLGTLGGGNHFLELQSASDGQLWLMIHSGSRGIGQAISTWHQRADADPAVKASDRLCLLEAASERGQAYLHDVCWARAYAAINRSAMRDAIVEILRRRLKANPIPESLIHSDHNHVQCEMHGDDALWVHRKGAQSARLGEAGVIPGSMGTPSFHTEGRGVAEALYSCSHGAGRRWHRHEARSRVSIRDLERQMKDVWYNTRQAHRLKDEAPSAYRDIRKVMRAQSDLVRITRELVPVLSYKGG